MMIKTKIKKNTKDTTTTAKMLESNHEAHQHLLLAAEADPEL